MTRYTVNVGTEMAEKFTGPFTLEAANGIEVEDLGDGRIRFDDEGLRWFRGQREIDDGFIDETEDGLQMWIGGLEHAVEKEGDDSDRG